MCMWAEYVGQLISTSHPKETTGRETYKKMWRSFVRQATSCKLVRPVDNIHQATAAAASRIQSVSQSVVIKRQRRPARRNNDVTRNPRNNSNVASSSITFQLS